MLGPLSGFCLPWFFCAAYVQQARKMSLRRLFATQKRALQIAFEHTVGRKTRLHAPGVAASRLQRRALSSEPLLQETSRIGNYVSSSST